MIYNLQTEEYLICHGTYQVEADSPEEASRLVEAGAGECLEFKEVENVRFEVKDIYEV